MRARALHPAAWPLSLRLTAWYALSSFLVVVAVAGMLDLALARNLAREDDEAIASKVQDLRDLVRSHPRAPFALEQEVEWEARLAEPHIRIRILDAAGHELMATPGMARILAANSFPRPGAPEPTTLPGGDGRAYEAVAVRGLAPGDRDVIQVALDRTPEARLLGDYRDKLAILLAVALAACSLIGHLIARLGMQPLSAIARTADRIRSTTLAERIRLSGLPPELSELAGALNAMLDRIEVGFERLSRFAADLAHELRTPLHNLRGEIEVAAGKPRSVPEYRDLLGSCLEECDRLSRIIDGMLFLARAEAASAQLAPEPVLVAHELETIRAFYEATAAEAGVALEVAAPEALAASWDRTLLQRAIANLVANALAHTDAGGRVTLLARRSAGGVHLEVTDTGTGIAEEHLSRVFDPFYRVDSARTRKAGGVGLGLSLVRRIVALHGGEVALQSTDGEGTRVSLLLPDC